MAWHPAEADTSGFVAQCPEEIHDLANERVVNIFAFNRLQARHWVRVDYDIVLYRIHVPIIIQCQCDCCCLSSKDGTVIWESFGQLAANRLTIQEMAVCALLCVQSVNRRYLTRHNNRGPVPRPLVQVILIGSTFWLTSWQFVHTKTYLSDANRKFDLIHRYKWATMAHSKRNCRYNLGI